MPPKKNNDIIEMMVREQEPPPIKKPKKPQLSMKRKTVIEILGDELAAKATIVEEESIVEKPDKPDKPVKKVKAKAKTVKIVDPKNRCIARRLNNEQCPRQHTKDSEFCASHMKKLSNGTVRDPIVIPPSDNGTVTRRGRKRKTEFSDKIYNDEFVAMWEHIIENEKYLMDKYGNIYTFDVEHPKFLGKQTLANKIELLQN